VTADAGVPTQLRVVHVITTLTTGGAERQLQAITTHSRHLSSTVALYAGGAVGDAMQQAGQDVHVLGMRGWRKALAIPRLALLLRRLRPDVVHVHLLAGQLWGIPAARLAGVRTVVSSEHSLMDSTIENRQLTGPLRRLYLLLEKMTSHTVAVSSTTRRRLVAWGVPDDRISVIDNGIDFAALRFSARGRLAVRDELGIAAAATVIGGVGRLEPVKRFPQLLTAVAPTLARGRRELVLAGDGPLRSELRDMARRLGVDDAVHLLGPRSDVRELLSAMDVLVSPSRDETFGMAVIEGLGSGLPVVYAQCPALTELPPAPAWAVQLPGADGRTDDESEAIRWGVQHALQQYRKSAPKTPPKPLVERFPVPRNLIAAYGIGTTTRALDQLYLHLGRKSGSTVAETAQPTITSSASVGSP
jgi:glycosyltransferase involved in cell wall biosynthesis